MANQQSTDGQLRELALFAGAGGGILGGHLLGWQTVCAVEWEPYPACVLACRQNDGILPPFPVWDDVQTFDGKPWRGLVDVVSGGFPCQDISAAGKGEGISGTRSSMWKHMARIIHDVRPAYAYVENSPLLVSRGLVTVISDLTEMGYGAKWGCLSAADCGANHERDRIWILASNTDSYSKPSRSSNEEVALMQKLSGCNVAHSDLPQCERGGLSGREGQEYPAFGNARWWQDTSPLHRVDDGVAARMDRLKAIGNGQVPLCAATAFRVLSQ